MNVLVTRGTGTLGRHVVTELRRSGHRARIFSRKSRTQVAAEAVVREDPVPWSMLRATQFHNFMEVVLGAFSSLPVVTAIPFGWQFQPVDKDGVITFDEYLAERYAA